MALPCIAFGAKKYLDGKAEFEKEEAEKKKRQEAEKKKREEEEKACLESENENVASRTEQSSRGENETLLASARDS